MAQMVCIDMGTKRANNEIGDIVAVHEDDVDLSGGGYSSFNIVQVEGMSKAKLEQGLVPEIEDKISKYSYNVGLSKIDIDSLKNSIINEQAKITILKKITANA